MISSFEEIRLWEVFPAHETMLKEKADQIVYVTGKISRESTIQMKASRVVGAISIGIRLF
jgi:hypothetical protein